MNNFWKIALLNKEIIYRKFKIFYEENYPNEIFNKEKFYNFMKIEIGKSFSLYVEYLFFVKNNKDDKFN